MAVVSSREILPRTFSHKFGESPAAEIKYALTLDGPTAHQTMLDSVGIYHGTAHPEYAYLLCLEGSINETGRFNAEITYRYGTPDVGTAQYQASPLSRADVWSFSTSGVAVPAFRHYNGTGNADIKPLINTAGDIIEGAQAIEGELRVSIAGNRSAFPAASAVAVTGALNADNYLGAAAYQWQCIGISGQPTTEVVNGAQVTYWQVTVELSYKPSGYSLYLPNVGWNYISQAGTGNAKKRRCYVFSSDSDSNPEQVPSSNVMALNDDGSIRFNTDFTGSGAPTILQRRVNPAVNFATYFGTPPF
jgi:hypothetical protein